MTKNFQKWKTPYHRFCELSDSHEEWRTHWHPLSSNYWKSKEKRKFQNTQGEKPHNNTLKRQATRLRNILFNIKMESLRNRKYRSKWEKMVQSHYLQYFQFGHIIQVKDVHTFSLRSLISYMQVKWINIF